MSVTVKKAVLWRREVKNQPGVLAKTLAPLADAGVNVQVLMGYAFPGQPGKSAIEVYPVSGTKASVAAKKAGLHAGNEIACLHVQGRDEAGLGHRIATALGKAKVNINFVMVQVIGDKYSGFFGFSSAAQAEKASKIISDVSKSGATQSTVTKATTAKMKSVKVAKKPATITAIRGGKKTATRKAAQKKPATTREAPAKKTATRKKSR